ncbi:MAG: lysophospholipid acyltransferase family protein [Candidatus Aceula meridiana]|nr:lysophospholipid acyltransferase family protein [Candidatus Aceula meridiana]
MFYWPGFIFFWIFYKIFLRLESFGRENIPRKGGYLIASNHLSNLDPMIIGIAAGRKISFMAKDSLFKNCFFGFILRGVMAFPVRRGSLDVSTVKEAVRRLKTGGLVVFPQGTRRTIDFDLKGIKSGVGLLAAKADVPIVPAFINGSDKAMPPGAKFIRPAKTFVRFGKPIRVGKDLSYEETALKVMTEIKQLSQQEA